MDNKTLKYVKNEDDMYGKDLCTELLNLGYIFTYNRIDPKILPPRLDNIERDISLPQNRIILVMESGKTFLAFSGKVLSNGKMVNQWSPLYENMLYRDIRKREMIGKNIITYNFK